MKRALAVIPARYASTRFPGKPLARLAGKPMVQHVYERASAAKGFSRVLVATDDARIADAVRAFGGEVAMTGDCRTGTDRVFEASRALEADVVVNVQGDEPLLAPECLSTLLGCFDDPAVTMATLKRRLESGEAENPNVVKVVTALNGDALYFSRSLVPYPRSSSSGTGSGPSTPGSALRSGRTETAFAHVGLYAYTKPFLATLAALPSTPLELTESLEQLRVLEHGHRIRVAETSWVSVGVDTPEDLARAEERLRGLARSAR